MNAKDFKKMVEIMASLEPMNPRPVTIDNVNELDPNTSADFHFQSLLLSRRKQSLPSAVSAPSLGVRSTNKRQSLFNNELSYSSNNLQRLTLCPANVKSLLEVSQETECSKIVDEKFLNDERYHKNVNVYDITDKRISSYYTDSQTSDCEQSTEDIRNTITESVIDCRKPKNIMHRNSLDLFKMKELKFTKSCENLISDINIEDNSNDLKESSSSPKSVIISSFEDSGLIKPDRLSAGSSAESPMLRMVHSFPSNTSQLSPNGSNDKTDTTFLSSLETKSNNDDNEGFLSTTSPSKMEQNEKSEDQFKQKSISNIKSEEEQNKFFRRMSNKLSLDSFSTKEIIKFFMRDGIFSAQIVDKFQTAGTVCKSLRQKYRIPDVTFCNIIEVITKESLERPLQDHENILEIFSSWKDDNSCNKFIFEEDANHNSLFLQQMTPLVEIKYNVEITDLMWLKAPNSKWIRSTCFIKDNGIYYYSKQGSKDQKDLYCLANLKTTDFYTCPDLRKIKKEYKSPTMDLIVFKESKVDHKINDNAYLAPIDTQQKEKWLEALTVSKYSFNQLKHNHLEYRARLFSEMKQVNINNDASFEPQEPCSI